MFYSCCGTWQLQWLIIAWISRFLIFKIIIKIKIMNIIRPIEKILGQKLLSKMWRTVAKNRDRGLRLYGRFCTFFGDFLAINSSLLEVCFFSFWFFARFWQENGRGWLKPIQKFDPLVNHLSQLLSRKLVFNIFRPCFLKDFFLEIKYLFTLGHHDIHNRVSNSLAKKREPSKYNTMKACDG